MLPFFKWDTSVFHKKPHMVPCHCNLSIPSFIIVWDVIKLQTIILFQFYLPKALAAHISQISYLQLRESPFGVELMEESSGSHNAS